MTNPNPGTSHAPHQPVSEVKIVFEKGAPDGGWSVARLKSNGTEAVGIRWNHELPAPSPANEPASWFILPQEVAEAVVRSTERLLQDDEEALRAGYQAMAADEEQEAEAMEWIESHVGECL